MKGAIVYYYNDQWGKFADALEKRGWEIDQSCMFAPGIMYLESGVGIAVDFVESYTPEIAKEYPLLNHIPEYTRELKVIAYWEEPPNGVDDIEVEVRTNGWSIMGFKKGHDGNTVLLLNRDTADSAKKEETC